LVDCPNNIAPYRMFGTSVLASCGIEASLRVRLNEDLEVRQWRGEGVLSLRGMMQGGGKVRQNSEIHKLVEVKGGL
ncbi:hypothetical protein BHM03_00007494, partial [Ensete ventricosum]